MLQQAAQDGDGGRHAPAAPHVFQRIQRGKDVQPPACRFNRGQRGLQALFCRFCRGQHLKAKSQREREAVHHRDTAGEFLGGLLRGADHGSQRTGGMDRDDVIAAPIEEPLITRGEFADGGRGGGRRRA